MSLVKERAYYSPTKKISLFLTNTFNYMNNLQTDKQYELPLSNIEQEIFVNNEYSLSEVSYSDKGRYWKIQGKNRRFYFGIQDICSILLDMQDKEILSCSAQDVLDLLDHCSGVDDYIESEPCSIYNNIVMSDYFVTNMDEVKAYLTFTRDVRFIIIDNSSIIEMVKDLLLQQ